MFFKPNYCCSCGVRIERTEWGLLTSRRFCDVCAVENKGSDWFVRAAVAACVLFGIYGLGGSLVPQNGRGGESLANPSGTTELNRGKRPVALAPAPVPRPDTMAQPVPAQPSNAPHLPSGALKEQPRPERTASDEPVYYCGAMTRKGTPCSRRVKTKARCWQHVDQPMERGSKPERAVD